MNPARRRTRVFRRLIVSAVAVVAAVAGVVTAAPAHGADTPPWMNKALSADRRATLLEQQMTFDEKVYFVSNHGNCCHPAVARLGIPAVTTIDGALGARIGESPSTLMPAGPSLASTRSPDLAYAFGNVLGSETRSSGNGVILAPTLDLARTPNYGREFEALTEDPLLDGLIGAADTRGIQANNVIAMAKHYATNNKELLRQNNNVTVSERALQEVYLRPWENVVRNGGADGVMCGFSATNGQSSCGNSYLLNDALKGQFGFKGYVQSDFNATHATTDALAGLDFEDPETTYFGDNLAQAIRNGTIPESRLDDMVHRILYAYFKSGLMDNPLTSNAIPQSDLAAHAQVARQIAAAGTVLLKNAGGTLPLSNAGGQRIALIGGDADHIIQGGGSAHVFNPAVATDIVDGMTRRASVNGDTVTYVPGADPVSSGDMLGGPAPVPASVLSPLEGQPGPGLHGDYWANPDFQGNPTVEYDPIIDFATGILSQVSALKNPQTPFQFIPESATWSGYMTPPTTGTYQLSLTHYGRATLAVNDTRLIDAAALPDPTQQAVTSSTSLRMQAGRKYRIVITYQSQGLNDVGNGPVNRIKFGWVPPANTLSPNMQAAVDAARNSDTAVIVATDYNAESDDRADLTLPQDYDRLISAVSAVNPHTVVVLTTGGAVSMPWLNKVEGVVEAWYGGEQQGAALADILYGDVNPSGRLPVTFPTSLAATPTGSVAQYPGTTGANPVYSEGSNIGYRGYLADGIAPLFPFGYGLSYGTITYRSISATGFSAANARAVPLVNVTVTNRTKGPIDEPVDVYVSKLPGVASSPVRALAGTTSVRLAPGETRAVSVPIDRRSLQYWNSSTNAWVTPRGTETFSAGTSFTAAVSTQIVVS